MNVGINKKIACVFLVFILYGVDHAFAALSSADIKTTKIQVALNKSKLITLHSNIEEISQGNPAIADFPMDMEAAESTFMPPNQVMIRGKSLGTTNLYLWGAKGKIIQVLDIEVTHDLANLKAKLHELLPNETIGVRSSQKNIVLSGEVTTLANMQNAIQLAGSFLGTTATLGGGSSGGSSGSGNINVATNTAQPKVDPSASGVPQIINLMSVGGAQQVMLDVKVAEINRSVLKGLNVHFSALQVSNAFEGFSVAKLGGGMAGGVSGIQSLNSFSASNVFLSMLSGEFLLNLTIDAANEQGLAKILAQPTLTTLSGQAATFLSGGEFPIPVPQASGGNGAITIQFKQYGIGLKFVPIVLDSGRINMNMNISVSELSQDASVVAQAGTSTSSYSIPSLTKREASSTLELADGQTMSIAGLISEKMKESINKFPGLGDIPGLGVLFKDSKFAKDTTELVIFVTPRLAKPLLAQNALLPTDSFIEPDNVDFFVLGRTESRKVRNRWVDKDVATRSNKGGLDGDYGQQLVIGGQ
jgi:pilus assembly protein CpaC